MARIGIGWVRWAIALLISWGWALGATPAVVWAEGSPAERKPEENFTSPSSTLDLAPETLENSRVLKRWLRKIPNIERAIEQDPALPPRLQAGYVRFPTTEADGAWGIGLEDLPLGHRHLSGSAHYQSTFDGKRTNWGTEIHYAVRSPGRAINGAPLVGYRRVETDRYSTEGVDLGFRLVLALSRDGAADMVIAQHWVAPGSEAEVGITALAFGYALSSELRLSTDWQRQRARQGRGTQLGIGLEWLF